MNNNDKYIIRELKRDNLKIFEALFREYYPLMCELAEYRLKDTDASEEIVQDIFYNIWKNRKKLSISSSVKSYLLKATHNNCLQYLNHKKTERKYEDYIRNENKIMRNDPSDVLRYRELDQKINNTLDKLPGRCREIFTLSRFEGLKYREIAEKLEISVKTVEANMGKALRIFRHSLKDYVNLLIFMYSFFKIL